MTDLRFKPLTGGLGFQKSAADRARAPSPRAPEAPLRPNPSGGVGTGAVVAGPPSFLRGSQPEVAERTDTRESASFEELPLGAGFVLRRLLAFSTDLAIHGGIAAGALALVFRQEAIPAARLLDPAFGVLGLAFLGVLHWASSAIQEVAIGSTLGKRLFGLSMRRDPVRALIRAFLFVPSVLFGGVGLLWALFDRRRRCWHDLAAGLAPEPVADHARRA